MLPYKTPTAETKSLYPVFKQIGMVASLGIVLAAFTIPFSATEEVVVTESAQEIIELEDVDISIQRTPPPPPPPAPPPPREVPDSAEIEDEIVEAMDLDLGATFSIPTAPVPSEPTPQPQPIPVVEPEVEEAPPPEPEPEPEPEIFEVVETPPELIGGLEGLRDRLVYPKLAIDAGVSGTVYVQFVVSMTGAVSEIAVLRSPNDILSEAAIAAIEASEFTPGMQRGRPVNVRFTVPVRFELH
ncbi:MAG: energy transducer TonB [Bacteroidota bacterium]